MKLGLSDPEYQRIQGTFDAAKAACARTLAEVATARSAVIKDNWRWSAFSLTVALVGLGVLAVCVCLLVTLGLVGVIFDLAILAASATKYASQRKRVEEVIARACREELAPLEARAESARNALAAAQNRYHQECTYYRSYPPDWDERRNAALARDHGRCTQCGWPDGFQRKRRELHVHHVVALGRGGDNSIENLVTLCHLCHRDVDRYHNLVRHNARRRQ